MRVLIASHWMEIGGAERALLGLLHSIDYSQHNVDLYLARHTGEFMGAIPEEVNLLPEDKKAAAIAIPAKKAIKQGCADILLGRILAKILVPYGQKKYSSDGRVNNIPQEYSNRFTYPFVHFINPDVEYDLAISFLEPHYIVAHKVHAKKKIAWMHTDYGYIDVDTKAGNAVWKCYDKIIAISEQCKINFEKKYPQLSSRIQVIENISQPELIRAQADMANVGNEMTGEIKLLSIGRFAEAKNFDNVPQICSLIREKQLNVKWYIIGYGGSEELIRKKIAQYKMEDYVILLGKKVNPYPYIKACDLYVQPSRYEGKAVTVREAQILGKPVVITNYATSMDQVIDGYDGVIVPLDNAECADGIVSLLRDKGKMQELRDNCLRTDYHDKTSIFRIFD